MPVYLNLSHNCHTERVTRIFLAKEDNGGGKRGKNQELHVLGRQEPSKPAIASPAVPNQDSGIKKVTQN